ncbi:M28 family peptidase [Massilia sp. UMI-21]|nr:M28 family peptidase [Massilia sp. UMI-21]
MRKFARTHWKILIAILLAIALATLTLETDSAVRASGPASGPELSVRLRAHVGALASHEHDSAAPQALEQAARHIETTLAGYGYGLHRQEYEAGGQNVRNIEVAIANTAPGARPERIFIVGARYDAAPGAQVGKRSDADRGSGTAAVLELARLLKTMRPSRGTEVRFVFFVNAAPPTPPANATGEQIGGMPYASTGNFIAFAGTLESSARVRQALAAFQARPDFPTEGLAAPAHAMGVTWSDHASYKRHGYPALMITDTAFLRYPYYHTLDDTAQLRDYAGMARVLEGLARTIDALAGAART